VTAISQACAFPGDLSSAIRIADALDPGHDTVSGAWNQDGVPASG
jgi:hypothetical protein